MKNRAKAGLITIVLLCFIFLFQETRVQNYKALALSQSFETVHTSYKIQKLIQDSCKNIREVEDACTQWCRKTTPKE